MMRAACRIALLMGCLAGPAWAADVPDGAKLGRLAAALQAGAPNAEQDAAAAAEALAPAWHVAPTVAVALLRVLGREAHPEDDAAGQLTLLRSRYDRALKLLEGLSRNGEKLPDQLVNARALLGDGQFEAADTNLAAIVRARRDSGDDLAAEQVLLVQGELAMTRMRYADAVARFREAGDVLPLNRSRDTPVVDYHLAEALSSLGDPASLERSTQAWRRVMEQWTRDNEPTNWAWAQYNLGSVLATMSTARDADPAVMRQSVEAFAASLTERSPTKDMARWVSAQTAYGEMLGQLGARDHDAALLQQAVAAFRKVLDETSGHAPGVVPGQSYDAGRVQFDLGYALFTLAAQSADEDTAILAQSIAAFRLSLDARSRADRPAVWLRTATELVNALAHLGRRTADAAPLAQAQALAEQALDGLDRARSPSVWASLEGELGGVLGLVGAREHDAAALHRGVDAMEAALAGLSATAQPGAWASLQCSLAGARLALARLETGTDTLHAALAALDQARPLLGRMSYPSDVQECRAFQQGADALLAERSR